MTTQGAQAIQRELCRRGVTITVRDGRMALKWQQGAMTPAILTLLVRKRPALIAALSAAEAHA